MINHQATSTNESCQLTLSWTSFVSVLVNEREEISRCTVMSQFLTKASVNYAQIHVRCDAIVPFYMHLRQWHRVEHWDSCCLIASPPQQHTLLHCRRWKGDGLAQTVDLASILAIYAYLSGEARVILSVTAKISSQFSTVRFSFVAATDICQESKPTSLVQQNYLLTDSSNGFALENMVKIDGKNKEKREREKKKGRMDIIYQERIFAFLGSGWWWYGVQLDSWPDELFWKLTRHCVTGYVLHLSSGFQRQHVKGRRRYRYCAFALPEGCRNKKEDLFPWRWIIHHPTVWWCQMWKPRLSAYCHLIHTKAKRRYTWFLVLAIHTGDIVSFCISIA